jgi:hypothetical protein
MKNYILKKTYAGALGLLAFTVFSLSANAGTLISFGSSTSATAYTDVLNNDTTALAYDSQDANNSTTTAVNGVLFTGSQDPNGLTGVRIYSIPHGFGTLSNGVNPISGAANATYNDILAGSQYYIATQNLSFANLTPGDTYLLQIFAGSTQNPQTNTETLTDGTVSADLAYGPATSASGADFITETFTADNTGEETIQFSVKADNQSSYEGLNALDLRVVPEPSSMALVSMGLAACVLIYLRRKSARLL